MPEQLNESDDMDAIWGKLYHQAKQEVDRGFQPSWSLNAAYMGRLVRKARIDGDYRRADVLSETLQGLREREKNGDIAPMGPQVRMGLNRREVDSGDDSPLSFMDEVSRFLEGDLRGVRGFGGPPFPVNADGMPARIRRR